MVEHIEIASGETVFGSEATGLDALGDALVALPLRFGDLLRMRLVMLPERLLKRLVFAAGRSVPGEVAIV